MIQYNTFKPIELIEEIQMKEKPDTRMDPVLEECYRMKEAFAAKFNSMQKLNDYLVAETEKNKALGRKYLPHRSPEPNAIRRINLFTRHPLDFTELL
ncbi:MAG: hypothetical protein OXI63_11560 [Candidatus Poribacteria bacterium]|nr:hypothetical protein [Candidatus Poribacteria bacterium]